jgi:hypothetical protein
MFRCSPFQVILDSGLWELKLLSRFKSFELDQISHMSAQTNFMYGWVCRTLQESKSISAIQGFSLSGEILFIFLAVHKLRRA